MIAPTRVDYNINCNIYRGQQPQTTEDFQLLKSLKISTLLDLETSDIFDGSQPMEHHMAEAEGLEVIWYPIGRVLPPSSSELTELAAILVNTAPLGLYVHCKDGVDRTGLVVAKYRMQANGWSKSAAVAEMRRKGMHFWYWWWQWRL